MYIQSCGGTEAITPRLTRHLSLCMGATGSKYVSYVPVSLVPAHVHAAGHGHEELVHRLLVTRRMVSVEADTGPGATRENNEHNDYR
jgi:hypothetical protein